MPGNSKVCAISGSTGYVGSRIAAFLGGRGWTIVSADRRSEEFPFSLGQEIDPALWRAHRIDVLIHCAYDFSCRSEDEIRRVNVEGSRKFLRSAKEAGVAKIILISTISAFEGCRSLYGQAKTDIEKTALEMNAWVVRPGLVYGEENEQGGMLGTLTALVRNGKIIPLIGSGKQKQYMTHEEDLCALLQEISEGRIENPNRPILACAEAPLEFGQLLHGIAARLGKKIVLVPLPAVLIWLALKTLELSGAKISARSDSVVSLQNPNPHLDFEPLKKTGVAFRPFSR